MFQQTVRLLAVGLAALLCATPALAGGGPVFVDAEVFDFDDNDRSDILVDTSGAPIRVVQLNGASAIGNAFPAITGAGETVIGSGDFDDDGQAEIVAQNTGSNYLRIIDLNSGLTGSTSAFFPLPGAFALIGIGELDDGDNIDDLAFYNTSTGVVRTMIMSSATAVANVGFPAVLSSNEDPVGVGQVDGTAGGDIVVYTTNGSRPVRVIPLASSGLATAGASVFPMTVPAGAIPIGVGNFDAGNNADIVLRRFSNPNRGLIRVAFTGMGATSIAGNAFPILTPTAVDPTNLGNYDGTTSSTDILARNAGTGVIWQLQMSSSGANATSVDTVAFPALVPAADEVVRTTQAEPAT